MRIALLLASVVGLGCNFSFARDQGIAPGEIQGLLFRDDVDEAAAFSRVAVPGSLRITRAADDGRFHVAGLPAGDVVLRFEDDSDGDGWPERGGFAGARLPTGPDGEVGFVLLGTVGINGTMNVNGTVLLDTGAALISADLVARVFAMRGQCLSFADASAATQNDCGLDDTNRIETGTEVVTAVDEEGKFALAGVLAGTAELVVIVTRDNGDALGEVVDVRGPFLVTGAAGDDVAAAAIVIPSELEPLGSRPVTIGANPPADGADVVFSTAGSGPPPCGADAADHPTAVFFEDALEGGADAQLEVPFGAWDVTVCGDDGLSGTALGLLAIPGSDIPPRWLVLRSRGDVCLHERDGETVVDCDDDLLQALPPLAAATEGLWADCAPQCWNGEADGLGDEVARARCTAAFEGADEVFDCDDDGDGQPDTTEPDACRGPGRGTDLDGDFACSLADPSPQCTSNDVAACPVGEEDLAPPNVIDGPPDPDGIGSWQPGPAFPDGAVTSSPVVVPLHLFNMATNTIEVTGAAIFAARTGAGALRDDALVLAFDDLAAGFVPTAVLDEDYQPFFGAALVAEGGSIVAAGGFLADGQPTPVVRSMFADEGFGVGAASFDVPDVGAGLGALAFVQRDPTTSSRFVYSGGARALDGGPLDDVVVADNVSFFGGAGQIQLLTLVDARKSHRAIGFLSPPRVVVLGGIGAGGAPLASSEVIDLDDPAAAQLNAGAAMSSARSAFTVTPLSPSTALVVGGRGVDGALDVTEILDVATGAAAFSAAAALNEPRADHAATLLADGRVLITGGFDDAGAAVASAEVYDPVSDAWVPLAQQALPRGLHEAVLMPDDRVMVLGGKDAPDGDELGTTEIFAFDEPTAGEGEGESGSEGEGEGEGEVPDAGPITDAGPDAGPVAVECTITSVTASSAPPNGYEDAVVVSDKLIYTERDTGIWFAPIVVGVPDFNAFQQIVAATDGERFGDLFVATGGTTVIASGPQEQLTTPSQVRVIDAGGAVPFVTFTFDMNSFELPMLLGCPGVCSGGAVTADDAGFIYVAEDRTNGSIVVINTSDFFVSDTIDRTSQTAAALYVTDTDLVIVRGDPANPGFEVWPMPDFPFARTAVQFTDDPVLSSVLSGTMLVMGGSRSVDDRGRLIFYDVGVAITDVGGPIQIVTTQGERFGGLAFIGTRIVAGEQGPTSRRARVVNIADPATPVLEGQLTLPAGADVDAMVATDATHVDFSGTTLSVADCLD
jgi:hypothetical protein